MKVYFVRHGQTEHNVKYLHQSENAPLSSEGLKQAKILAKRCSKIPLDMIFASPVLRAKQTAEIINKKLKKQVVYFDSLREWKRPSEFEGKSNKDELVKKVHKIMDIHQDNPAWHYSDEENFIEFKNRVKSFLDFLTNEASQKNVLVVAHSGSIKMLTLLMALGGLIAPQIYYGFADTFRVQNTSITFCEKGSDGWSIEAFNDHRHLG